MTDAIYAELARKMSDGVSSLLSDHEREHAIERAADSARLLLEVCKDREGACLVAVSISKIVSALSQTPAGALSQALDRQIAAFAMVGGMTAGSIAIPASEGDDETEQTEQTLVPTGQYL